VAVTGLSAELSAVALKCLGEDFGTLARYAEAGVRLSFGAPWQHLHHESFVRAMERFVSDGIVPAERLELRISEKTSVARCPRELKSLAQRGVQLVVDDIGRGAGFSLDWLAHAPMRGLQLNGSWVRAVPKDQEAMKMCRAGTALAKALRWTPIAVGVDEAVQRDALLDLGCEQGSGELYGGLLRRDVERDIIEDACAIVAA
jgi:EAL domain-containing protein (putative c-di-GMP-specific phosphodiesterase class I)